MPIPSDYAGLVLHYSPDANVYKDAGVTPPADGETVQQINDLSGGGFNATQATAGNRPTWKSAIINGRAILRFASASSNYLNIGRGFPSDFTAFFLAKRVSSGANQGLLGNGSDNLILQRGSSGNLAIWDSTNGWREDGQISTTAYVVVCVRRSQTDKEVRFYINNSLTAVGTWTGSLPGSSSLWWGRTNGSGEYINADIGELFVYDQLRSEAEIGALSDYLGITQYALWSSPGNVRATQAIVEAVHKPVPYLRSTQAIVEAVHKPVPYLRASQVVLEVAHVITPPGGGGGSSDLKAYVAGMIG